MADTALATTKSAPQDCTNLFLQFGCKSILYLSILCGLLPRSLARHKVSPLLALYCIFSLIHTKSFPGACLLSCPDYMMFGTFELEVLENVVESGNNNHST